MFRTEMVRPLVRSVMVYSLVVSISQRVSFRAAAAPRIARSRAVVYMSSSWRPEALVKWLWVMPSSWAFWFISSAKPLSEPPTCSATALAASQPEGRSIPYIRSSSRYTSPSFTPILALALESFTA